MNQLNVGRYQCFPEKAYKNKMDYFQEQGDQLNDRRIVRFDDIDNHNVTEFGDFLWFEDFYLKLMLCCVNLEDFDLFRFYRHSLPDYVGVMGFVGQEKFMNDYASVSLHRGRRPRENVHFFIDHYDNDYDNEMNLEFSYAFYDQHIEWQTQFVIIGNAYDLVSGQTITNQSGQGD
ncbi:hypothetical protein BgiMline_028099 [Biomphalaria glabrata]